MGKRLPCILVVEDDPATRKFIVAVLEAAGHKNVVSAGNAEEALAHVFKDPGLLIRLAVVDLVLPNTSGLTLIRRIREAKTPWRKNMPIVVMTGRRDPETYNLAAKRGIHAYLVKPFTPEVLIETVNQLLAAKVPGAPSQPPVKA